jgi:hypothetical protein
MADHFLIFPQESASPDLIQQCGQTKYCFVCKRMRENNWKRRIVSVGQIKHCVLCQRHYCEHQSNEENICEVNHNTYFRNHRHLRDIYPDLAARDAAGSDTAQKVFSCYNLEDQSDKPTSEQYKGKLKSMFEPNTY